MYTSLIMTAPNTLLMHGRLDSQYPVKELGDDDVAVDVMMCPINPSDINQVQGKVIRTLVEYC